jgi:LysM repeat protein
MVRLTRVVVALSISLATFGLSSVTTHAAPPAVYVVKQGDSLSRIADKLGVGLPALLSANNMTTSSLIVPGQELVVPGTGAQPGSGGTSSYTVKAGDSLFGIATRHGVKLGALLSANKMTIDSVIMPGMVLTLPAGAVSQSAPPPPAQPATGGSYTVKAGDSLGAIARRNGVSLRALLAANNLVATSLILPGMTLVLPAGATAAPAANPQPPAGSTYTVKAGDSLSAIASRHGVKLGALLRANNMNTNSLITPGMTLNLPAGAQAAAPAQPSASTSSAIQKVLDYALAQQGKPYQFAADGPESFDCSGLVKASYAQIGINLVHQSAVQATKGTAVAYMDEPIRPGDLVFMATRNSDVINHVGIAITATTWIQAPNPGAVVRVGPMPARTSIVAVRRLVP